MYSLTVLHSSDYAVCCQSDDKDYVTPFYFVETADYVTLQKQFADNLALYQI